MLYATLSKQLGNRRMCTQHALMASQLQWVLALPQAPTVPTVMAMLLRLT